MACAGQEWALRQGRRDAEHEAQRRPERAPVFEHDDPRLDAANASGGTRSSETGVREFARLAATREEAAAIAATAPEGGALRALGFRASRKTALSPELAQCRIVHDHMV